MPNEYQFPDRRFQIWLYTVGHRQLLIRSVRTDNDPRRIDVLFSNVSVISMPTWPDGMRIRKLSADSGDLAGYVEAGVALKSEAGDSHFLLEGDGWRGFISCGSIAVAEDELAYDDPSPFSDSLMGKA